MYSFDKLYPQTEYCQASVHQLYLQLSTEISLLDRKSKKKMKKSNKSKVSVQIRITFSIYPIQGFTSSTFFISLIELLFKKNFSVDYHDPFVPELSILRNILVNKDGSLMSIDEGDIYGKRPYIFGKNDWFKRKENIVKTRKLSQSIIDDWDLNNKIPVIKKQMELYKFEAKIEEMENRMNNYKSIVSKELED